MTKDSSLPRVLIVDDLFGRAHPDQRNKERANLCGQYLIEDVTGDEAGKGTPQKIKRPIAQVVFYRGQIPTCSTVGDTVENDLEGTLQTIRDGWSEWRPDKHRWTMVLLDLCFYTGRVTEESSRKALGMPEGRDGDDDPGNYFGLRILRAIHDEFPDLPVVILSSKSRDAVSHEFSQKGALGFLAREAEDSPDLLKDYIWRHGLIPDHTGEIIGHSRILLLSLRAARRAASDRRNILIRGERGTGKDLLANYIHRQSQDQESKLFVIVNSSVLTSELFASELFGIEEGVATDVSRREGLISQANGGDIFLDEIKDMLPQVQAGILRVLEERRITSVGSSESRPVDVRFLSATNADIEALAATDRFRTDLLDRLREGGTMLLPPLRERMEDVPLLVEKFVRDAESANPNALRREIDPEAMEIICSYNWPGNVRALRSCIFSAVSNNPDVEYLAPVHIRLPEDQIASEVSLPGTETDALPDSKDRAEVGDLHGLLRALDTFSFESAGSAQLARKLPEIQGAYARLIARYLKASLKATSKSTLDNPEGEILIQPAMKLMTGDKELTGSSAYDLIKRLLGISPKDVEPLLAEPMLKEALERALHNRPKRPRKAQKKEE